MDLSQEIWMVVFSFLKIEDRMGVGKVSHLLEEIVFLPDKEHVFGLLEGVNVSRVYSLTYTRCLLKSKFLPKTVHLKLGSSDTGMSTEFDFKFQKDLKLQEMLTTEFCDVFQRMENIETITIGSIDSCPSELVCYEVFQKVTFPKLKRVDVLTTKFRLKDFPMISFIRELRVERNEEIPRNVELEKLELTKWDENGDLDLSASFKTLNSLSINMGRLSNSTGYVLERQICKCQCLHRLELKISDFVDFVKFKDPLNSIEILLLKGGGISSWRDVDGSTFPNLKELNLSHNNLSPKIMRSVECYKASLEILNLKSNSSAEQQQHSDDLEWLNSMKCLKYLNLSFCKIVGFPASATRLSNLSYLNLSGNQLKELPKDIFSSFDLMEKLKLRGCGLLSLKNTSLESMKKLKYFDIRWNEMNDLPSDLQSLKELTTFLCIGNPWKLIPVTIHINGMTKEDQYSTPEGERSPKPPHRPYKTMMRTRIQQLKRWITTQESPKLPNLFHDPSKYRKTKRFDHDEWTRTHQAEILKEEEDRKIRKLQRIQARKERRQKHLRAKVMQERMEEVVQATQESEAHKRNRSFLASVSESVGSLLSKENGKRKREGEQKMVSQIIKEEENVSDVAKDKRKSEEELVSVSSEEEEEVPSRLHNEETVYIAYSERVQYDEDYEKYATPTFGEKICKVDPSVYPLMREIAVREVQIQTKKMIQKEKVEICFGELIFGDLMTKEELKDDQSIGFLMTMEVRVGKIQYLWGVEVVFDKKTNQVKKSQMKIIGKCPM